MVIYISDQKYRFCTFSFLSEEEREETTGHEREKDGRGRFNSDSEDIITLPHSFVLPPKQRAHYEPISLQMSSHHEYRSSSMSHPSINDFVETSKQSRTKLAVKKTHSDGSFGELLSSAEEERSVLQSHLSTDKLQSHMTDIIE